MPAELASHRCAGEATFAVERVERTPCVISVGVLVGKLWVGVDPGAGRLTKPTESLCRS